MTPVEWTQKLAVPRRVGVAALVPWSLLAGLLLVLFYETLASMAQVWATSATYGHGFLIPPIAAYLVWRRRAALAACPIRPSPWGLAALAGAGLVWLAGDLATVNVLAQFGLVGMLQATVLAAFGWPVVRVALFPLAYLLLAVPFGDFVVPPLQTLTAIYTVDLLRLSGIPVYLEDWRFVIPGGAFLVAEACAGARYLLACLALGLLICELMFRRWWKRFVFFALALAVPIVANVVRAYGIVMLAHLSDFEIAVGVDHLIYGWLFLSFVTAILIVLALWLSDREAGPAPAAGASGAVEAGSSAPRGRLTGMVVLAALSLVVLRGYGAWAEVPGQAVGLSAPAQVGAWTRAKTGTPPWRGDFPGADAQGAWTYKHKDVTHGDRRRVILYVAAYTHDRRGAELVAARNSLLGDPDAWIERRGHAAVPEAKAGLGAWPVPAALRFRAPGAVAPRLVWYWYRIGDTLTTNPARAKLAMLRAKLLGGDTRAAVVALSPGDPANDPEGAPAALADFARVLDPAALLRSAGARERGEN